MNIKIDYTEMNVTKNVAKKSVTNFQLTERHVKKTKKQKTEKSRRTLIYNRKF